MEKKTVDPGKIIPILILVLGALSLCFRARLSFCWSDESFYFSTSDRFLRGDLIFTDEWFPTQLVSLILLPFHGLYRLAAGGNDGVILYFRLLYVLFSLWTAIFIYRTLSRSCSGGVALIAALWYEFYVHLNIATLSYYTLSMGFFLVSMLLIYDVLTPAEARAGSVENAKAGVRAGGDYFAKAGVRAGGNTTAESRHPGAIRLILSGTALALSVLSLPTLALPYFAVVFLLLLISGVIRKYRARIWTGLLLNLAGILIPAVLVLIYVLPTTGLAGILNNLPYVLSDEEHKTSLVYPFKNFFLSVFDVFGKGPVLAALLIFTAGVILEAVRGRRIRNKDKKEAGTKNRHDNEKEIGAVTGAETDNSPVPEILHAGLLILNAVLFIRNLTLSLGHTGFAATVLLLFALPLFALTPGKKKNIRAFVLLFLGGMIFSMTFSYSSLCDLYVLSIGHNISAIAGIIFIGDYLTHTLEQRQTADKAIRRLLLSLSALVCCLFVLISTAQTIVLRFTNIYRDAPGNELTMRIDEGPARGLYTTPEHLSEYNSVLADIRELEAKLNASEASGASGSSGALGESEAARPRRIFFTKLLPWGYLATGLRCGAPTTWRTMISSDRLRLYYEEHPDYLPDVVFELSDTIGSYETCGDVESDPLPNENDDGGWLGARLRQDYTPLPASCGKLYLRNALPAE